MSRSIARSTLILLLASATWAASTQVHAQVALTTSVWTDTYRELPVPGGEPAQPVALVDGKRYGLPFPAGFTFDFAGVARTSINVGMKGYVTFGSGTSTYDVGINNAQALLSAGNPRDVIAAWWGDHICDEAAGELRTQVVGAAPMRWFVIQWQCLKRGEGSVPTPTRFQAQLWLLEGSSLIRAKYGTLSLAQGFDWETVSWGVKEGSTAGILGPDREGEENVCLPDRAQGSIPKCMAAAHFPSDSTIQYGASPGMDLAASLSTGDVAVTASSIEFEARTTLRNLGVVDADDVGYDLYLSQRRILQPDAPDVIFLGQGDPVSVEAGGSRQIIRAITTPRPPNGSYYLCVFIDPAARIAEFDRANNQICSSRRLRIGPDLVGAIEAPASGSAGATVQVPVSFQNLGNVTSGPFEVRITIEAEAFEDGTTARTEEVHVGVEGGLPAAGTRDRTLDVVLPQTLRGDRYRYVLRVNSDDRVSESDRSNNTSSSTTKMENIKPKLKITSGPEISMPDGCFFGERIEARFELCNEGLADAWSFRPGVAMGQSIFYSILNDVPAATAPQSCMMPGHPSYTLCAPIGDKTPSCALTSCRLECEEDADCGVGLRCGEDGAWAEHLGVPSIRSCMNALGQAGGATLPSCSSYVVSGTIPLADQDGTYYTDDVQTFHLVDDLSFRLSQLRPDVITSSEFACREALPDLTTLNLSVEPRFVAGKASSVTRFVRNLGFIEVPRDGSARPTTLAYGYRYFLASSPDLSIHQIPLAILGSGEAGSGTIGRKGDELHTDLLVIPEELRAGMYYLGLILDPEGGLRELSKANNTYVFPTPIEVEAASLRIVTHALPPAVAWASYHHQLVAVGGAEELAWEGEDLPPGLHLDAGGLLAGEPQSVGTFDLKIRVRSGALSVQRRFALQVRLASSPLEVSTAVLAPALRNLSYAGWTDELGGKHQGLTLAASGGAPPYVWELDPDVSPNRLPEGLWGPTEGGVVWGMPTTLSTTTSFVVRVRDSLGTTASRTLTIPVVGAADLVIPNPLFAEGRTASPYHDCIEASGGDTSAAYGWEVVETSLPEGLVPEAGDRRLCLAGTPTVCGNHLVEVSVQDAGGQSYAAVIPLAVGCEELRPGSRVLPDVMRGAPVEQSLTSRTTQGATWRIHRGLLPAGLVLSQGGLISGVVAEDASVGTYELIVEARDELGRIGLGALSITVVEEPVEGRLVKRKVSTSGCASAGGGGTGLFTGLIVMGLIAKGFARRRRSSSGAGAEEACARGTAGPFQPSQTSGSHGRLARSALGNHLSGPILGALFGIVVGLGCGGTTEETVLVRCEANSCERGMSCDPADGLCKCGDRTCLAGDVCSPEPTPLCVTSLCEFTSCENGESCDPLTGACVCGNSPCGEEEVCVNQVCQGADRCAASSCEGELRCDPADGACKCEGAVCGSEERCLQGSCVIDRCAGVTCGASGSCDPEDGVCRCPGEGGLVCAAGELCEEEGGVFGCVPAVDHCADVICEGGTSCDPADGRCRCGGFGEDAPICAAGQSCIDGACKGGLLCELDGTPTQCGTGLSCDPADGLCKCGGSGGILCGDDEHCLDLGERLECVGGCELFALTSVCASGESCYFDHRVVEGEAFCAGSGELDLGFNCESSSECRAGMFCTAAGKCRSLCELGEPQGCAHVSSSASCAMIQGAPTGVGYCADG